jgi:hypothetical protein
MEGVAVTKRRSRAETGIPLYLVPQVVARQIRQRGTMVFRISVKRTHLHYYNVTVRTKSLPRELMPGHGPAGRACMRPAFNAQCTGGDQP